MLTRPPKNITSESSAGLVLVQKLVVLLLGYDRRVVPTGLR